jgi:photosystem II stability/assembly factor-like uncharacterized protein
LKTSGKQKRSFANSRGTTDKRISPFLENLMKYFILLCVLGTETLAQDPQWKTVNTKADSYFRGLSVVDDQVAWVSGSKGYVGRTINGGQSIRMIRIKNFEDKEFRSLYAFDSLTAITANAGSPAYVLRTTDGGLTWTVVYQNNHKEAFIDGMDFWNNKEGIVYGDPIEGSMLLLRTSDGGVSWQESPRENRPVLKQGEASFAASGTGIRCLEDTKVIIATGGKVSRLWISHDKAMHWTTIEPPIIQGETMTGIFSVAFLNSKQGIVVGGNYEKQNLQTNHILITKNGGKTWMHPVVPTRGMRECVEYVNSATVLATGIEGSDISLDSGNTWSPLSEEKKFSVVRKARTGSQIMMAGGSGQLKVLSLSTNK